MLELTGRKRQLDRWCLAEKKVAGPACARQTKPQRSAAHRVSWPSNRSSQQRTGGPSWGGTAGRRSQVAAAHQPAPAAHWRSSGSTTMRHSQTAAAIQPAPQRSAAHRRAQLRWHHDAPLAARLHRLDAQLKAWRGAEGQLHQLSKGRGGRVTSAWAEAADWHTGRSQTTGTQVARHSPSCMQVHAALLSPLFTSTWYVALGSQLRPVCGRRFPHMHSPHTHASIPTAPIPTASVCTSRAPSIRPKRLTGYEALAAQLRLRGLALAVGAVNGGRALVVRSVVKDDLLHGWRLIASWCQTAPALQHGTFGAGPAGALCTGPS